MPTLYHYTNAVGLAGILKEKAFWASEYRFLNDSSEFNHGWNLIFDALVLADRDIQHISPAASYLIGNLCENVNRSGIYGFVASLTTQGDLLSQWRGYNNGKGFSIGINSDWLNANAAAQDFSLIPVVYDEGVQQRSSADAVGLLIQFLTDLNGDPDRVSEIVNGWWKHALEIAFAFKTHHFSEEQEYRLFHIVDTWPTTMKVRTGTQGLVPYVPCKYDCVMLNNAAVNPRNLGLEKIIIGPAARFSQKIGVDALLATHGMRIEVAESEIPYIAD